MQIAVVDGQGGGIGRALIERIRQEWPDIKILALGTNALATAQMLKAGASAGATGENAICHNVPGVAVLLGAVGIISANAMLGELTPAMAQAISDSGAQKILLPLNQCGLHVAGVAPQPFNDLVESAVRKLKELL